MRIVLDSNVLVRAFTSESGPASALLELFIGSAHTLVLSNEILAELSRVLRYSRFIVALLQSEEEVFAFNERLRMIAVIVTVNPLTPAPIRDPRDADVLRTAIHGGARILCTCDRDFYEPPASVFLASRGIEVLTDTELLKRLRQ